VEILDRFRHPGFSAFQGSAIQPQDTAGREKLGVYILYVLSFIMFSVCIFLPSAGW
jgi:hypothetical protein